jgi:hypothetical protein
LTILRKDWLKKEAPKNKGGSDLFQELKEEIPVMRKQGESPVKNPHSFAQYMCDLCNTPYTISELRQCVLCGRWACNTCWTDQYYACKSCTGIIKIHSIRKTPLRE